MAERGQQVTREELERRFLQDIYRLPGGEQIKKCIQCGTCGGSCPTSDLMEYSPREIIAALRAGMLDRVVRSNTVWLCTSCYSCTVRCPSQIKITDMMYEIKRLGIEYGMFPKGTKSPVLSKTFVEVIDKRGRGFEFDLMRKFYMRSGGWLEALRNINVAWNMFRRGRLALRPVTIKGRDQLRQIMESAERED
jgi:quinone-modifying oxidoreductase subunit QmoC